MRTLPETAGLYSKITILDAIPSLALISVMSEDYVVCNSRFIVVGKLDSAHA